MLPLKIKYIYRIIPPANSQSTPIFSYFAFSLFPLNLIEFIVFIFHCSHSWQNVIEAFTILPLIECNSSYIFTCQPVLLTCSYHTAPRAAHSSLSAVRNLTWLMRQIYFGVKRQRFMQLTLPHSPFLSLSFTFYSLLVPCSMPFFPP